MDIIDHLRVEGGLWHVEAIAEIERLREHASDFHHDICAENDNLRAEIEQVKGALAEMLVEFIAAHKEGHLSTFPETAQRIIQQAKALLSLTPAVRESGRIGAAK